MSDKGQTVLITGTSRGIGEYLARHYLDSGWVVAGCSRGEATIDHRNYRHWTLDVADESQVTAMVRECARIYSSIGALVNNAGIASMNAALLTPGDALERLFRTNCFGAFYFAREAGKIMTRQGSGRIVFFSTVARPLHLEGELGYAASKAAVESMTRVLSKELAASGITVNAVGPTPIRTDLLKGVPEEAVERLLDRQPIRRLGEFSDVANVVDFFLLPGSSFITGQVIYLGGVAN